MAIEVYNKRLIAMRGFMIKIALGISMLLLSSNLLAEDSLESTKPTHPLNTATLIARIYSKVFSNTHYRIIGACGWLERKWPPKVTVGPAVEQYLPDLVITVSNNPGENPWAEAGLLYENQLAQSAYQKAFELAFNFPLGFGEDSSQSSYRLNEGKNRIVHVLGAPALALPYVSHRAETGFLTPYYASTTDAVIERTDVAEIAYMATHPQVLFKEIGPFGHSWGPELPRSMSVTQPSGFRASVVAALHAADIVTNQGFHIKRPTNNTCGPNCVVSNVIYDPESKKTIWQEVYPLNRKIKPGDIDDFGEDDEKAGNGNYVFVVWRKYRGCVEQKGKLWSKFPKVGQPEKR